ncbi:hypothetical protein CO674_28665 [Rhizobium hidalgonense]|uniref:Uncharacterized protein n=1 Tax=Rhizobium hidalgonense TaxID=1538159 RepID=A0ABX4JKX7_9HYPH|nr:hypothetical protein CO674_28665 [Rhizobium hidalgonense]
MSPPARPAETASSAGGAWRCPCDRNKNCVTRAYPIVPLDLPNLPLNSGAIHIYGSHSYRTAPAIPFIADDITETFDDFRAEEALRLFTEMSGHGILSSMDRSPCLTSTSKSSMVDDD